MLPHRFCGAGVDDVPVVQENAKPFGTVIDFLRAVGHHLSGFLLQTNRKRLSILEWVCVMEDLSYLAISSSWFSQYEPRVKSLESVIVVRAAYGFWPQCEG